MVHPIHSTRLGSTRRVCIFRPSYGVVVVPYTRIPAAGESRSRGVGVPSVPTMHVHAPTTCPLALRPYKHEPFQPYHTSSPKISLLVCFVWDFDSTHNSSTFFHVYTQFLFLSYAAAFGKEWQCPVLRTPGYQLEPRAHNERGPDCSPLFPRAIYLFMASEAFTGTSLSPAISRLRIFHEERVSCGKPARGENPARRLSFG